jgi:hypothetical protein
MRHAAWTVGLVLALAGSVALAANPACPLNGTRIEGAISAIDLPAQQLVVADTTVQVTAQTIIKKNGRTIAFSDLVVGMTVAACGTVQDGVLVARQVTVKSCQTTAVASAVVTAPVQSARVVPLSAAEQEGLLFMREEEKLARDVYITLGAQWNVSVFANIVKSEQTHMDAILTLLTRYGVADPVAGLGVGEFATEHFQTLYADLIAEGSASLTAALAVGAQIEEIDILDLETRLAATTHADVLRVYGNLEQASENHLRAFVTQLAKRGVVYEPQYLDADQYAEIIGG